MGDFLAFNLTKQSSLSPPLHVTALALDYPVAECLRLSLKRVCVHVQRAAWYIFRILIPN